MNFNRVAIVRWERTGSETQWLGDWGRCWPELLDIVRHLVDNSGLGYLIWRVVALVPNPRSLSPTLILNLEDDKNVIFEIGLAKLSEDIPSKRSSDDTVKEIF